MLETCCSKSRQQSRLYALGIHAVVRSVSRVSPDSTTPHLQRCGDIVQDNLIIFRALLATGKRKRGIESFVSVIADNVCGFWSKNIKTLPTTGFGRIRRANGDELAPLMGGRLNATMSLGDR